MNPLFITEQLPAQQTKILLTSLFFLNISIKDACSELFCRETFG